MTQQQLLNLIEKSYGLKKDNPNFTMFLSHNKKELGKVCGDKNIERLSSSIMSEHFQKYWNSIERFEENQNMNRPIFGYDYNGQNVEWTWRVREVEKIYWKTWKPKLSDVKILNLTDSDEVSKVQQEIFQGVMDSEHPKKEKLTGIYKVRKKHGS